VIKEVSERSCDRAVGEFTAAGNAGKTADDRGRDRAAEQMAGVGLRMGKNVAEDWHRKRANGSSQCSGTALGAAHYC
jgi:hypothetical protein